MTKRKNIDPIDRLASTLIRRQGESFPPEEIEKKIKQCNEEFHLLIKANELRHAVLEHELCSTTQGLELVFMLRRSRQGFLPLESFAGPHNDPFSQELELVLQRCKSLPNDYRRAVTTSDDPSRSNDIQRLRRHASARFDTGLLEQLSGQIIQTQELQRPPKTLPHSVRLTASFLVRRFERSSFRATIVSDASHQHGGARDLALHKTITVQRLGKAFGFDCGQVLAWSVDTGLPVQAPVYVEFSWESRTPIRYSISDLPVKESIDQQSSPLHRS